MRPHSEHSRVKRNQSCPIYSPPRVPPGPRPPPPLPLGCPPFVLRETVETGSAGDPPLHSADTGSVLQLLYCSSVFHVRSLFLLTNHQEAQLWCYAPLRTALRSALRSCGPVRAPVRAPVRTPVRLPVLWSGPTLRSCGPVLHSGPIVRSSGPPLLSSGPDRKSVV